MKRIGIIMFGAMVWMAFVAISAVQAADRKMEKGVSMPQIIEHGSAIVDATELDDHVIARKPLVGKKVKYTYEIVVSFSDFTLHVFDRDGSEVFTAPVTLPRRTPKLPVDGEVISIDRKPWWFPPKGVKAYVLKHNGKTLPDKVPPGPNNPMGPVKFSFHFFTPGAEQLSRVHGTNHPESIGTRASAGCIRMYNEDALALCELLEPTFKTGGKIAVLYVKDLETIFKRS